MFRGYVMQIAALPYCPGITSLMLYVKHAMTAYVIRLKLVALPVLLELASCPY